MRKLAISVALIAFGAVILSGCAPEVTDAEEADACTRISQAAHVFTNALEDRDDLGLSAVEGIAGAITPKDSAMSAKLRALSDDMQVEAQAVVAALRVGDDDSASAAAQRLDSVNSEFVAHCEDYWP